jgi:hypothetical protein
MTTTSHDELSWVEKHPEYMELVVRQTKAMAEFSSRQSMERVRLSLELKMQKRRSDAQDSES